MGCNCCNRVCTCNKPADLYINGLERKVADLHSRNDRQEAEIQRLRRNMSANQKYTPQAIEKIEDLEALVVALTERNCVLYNESKANLKAFNTLRDGLRTLVM